MGQTLSVSANTVSLAKIDHVYIKILALMSQLLPKQIFLRHCLQNIILSRFYIYVNILISRRMHIDYVKQGWYTALVFTSKKYMWTAGTPSC